MFSYGSYSWVYKSTDAGTIVQWINANVDYPKHHCFFYAAVLALLFDLKLIRGRYEFQDKGDSAHFWAEDKDGIRYDPTVHQYKKDGKYFGGEEIDPIKNINDILKDKLFRRLSKVDQDKIKKMAAKR